MYVSKLYSSRKFIVRAQRVHILNRYITNVKHNFSVCVRILIITVTIRLSQFNFLQVLISYFEKKLFFVSYQWSKQEEGGGGGGEGGEKEEEGGEKGGGEEEGEKEEEGGEVEEDDEGKKEKRKEDKKNRKKKKKKMEEGCGGGESIP